MFDRNPPVESSTEDVRIGIEFFKETFDRGYLCTANTPFNEAKIHFTTVLLKIFPNISHKSILCMSISMANSFFVSSRFESDFDVSRDQECQEKKKKGLKDVEKAKPEEIKQEPEEDEPILKEDKCNPEGFDPYPAQGPRGGERWRYRKGFRYEV